jgi:DNA-binding CsgD family transcriptional regulator
MDIIFLSLFAGINIAFAIFSFYVSRKNDARRLYSLFSVFSFFSGIYFLLLAIEGILSVDIRWAIILCAAIYYGVFPWFILEFTKRKKQNYLWILSSVFALAFFVFVVYPQTGKFAIWQVLAHIGLIGLMVVTISSCIKFKRAGKRGANEFMIMCFLFVFLGLEEIITNYTGQKFLAKMVDGIIPLDIYPLLFTVVIGIRLSNDFNYKSRMETEQMKNNLNKKVIQLKEIEKQRLKAELNYKKQDLTNFGIEISRNKTFINSLYNNLIGIKENSKNDPDQFNDILKQIRSQLIIDKDFKYFHENVDKVNHKFISKLQKVYPSLTNNELHLASLLRLNLNTKEIATVKNISPDSVKVLRYRLRKKFNLSTPINLSQFLKDY